MRIQNENLTRIERFTSQVWLGHRMVGEIVRNTELEFRWARG